MASFVGAFKVTASGPIGPKIQSQAAQGFAAQNGYVTLMGWALTETGGVTNETVTLTDGGVSGGNLIAPIVVPKGTTNVAWFGPEGVRVSVQLYAAISGGTLSGVLFIR